MSLADVVFRIVGAGTPRYPEPPADLVSESRQAMAHADRANVEAEYQPDTRIATRWASPRGPDPIVFGIPLEQHEVYAVDAQLMTTCYPCGVKWAGEARCWHCGRTAPRFANPLSD